MIDLKQLRAELNISQAELAGLFDCTQGFISHIEMGKTVMPLAYEQQLEQQYGKELVEKCRLDKVAIRGNRLDSLLGFRDYASPEFAKYQKQLVYFLDGITERTGMDVEAISQKIYGKKKTIREALETGLLSPNMAKYIAKHLTKLGLQKEELKLPPAESYEEKSGKNIPFLHNGNGGFPMDRQLKEADRVEEHIYIPGIIKKDVDFFIRATGDNMAPLITNNDLIGLKDNGNDPVRFRMPHFLVFANGSSLVQYINPGQDEEHWNLSDEKEKTRGREILATQVKRIYRIVITIHEWR